MSSADFSDDFSPVISSDVLPLLLLLLLMVHTYTDLLPFLVVADVLSFGRRFLRLKLVSEGSGTCFWTFKSLDVNLACLESLRVFSLSEPVTYTLQ